jgi:hypothetical protein
VTTQTITFDAELFIPGGTEDTSIEVEAKPYRPAGWEIPLDPGEFGVPNLVTKTITPTDNTLILERTGIDWVWRLRIRHGSNTLYTTRYVSLLADANYLDLIDVDPETLDPATQPAPAWLSALNGEITRATAAEAGLLALIQAVETGDVDSVAGLVGIVTASALKAAINLPTDTVAELTGLDGRLDGHDTSIADLESDLDIETGLARNADNITSGTLDEARIDEAIARVADMVAAIAAEAALARDASNLSVGTIPDARIPAGITRDSELAAALAALVDAAPGTLDTLNELAAALGDDPNFAATITAALGTKASTTALATEVTDRINAVAGEASARAAAVTGEANTRAAAVTALDTRLTTVETDLADTPGMLASAVVETGSVVSFTNTAVLNTGLLIVVPPTTRDVWIKWSALLGLTTGADGAVLTALYDVTAGASIVEAAATRCRTSDSAASHWSTHSREVNVGPSTGYRVYALYGQTIRDAAGAYPVAYFLNNFFGYGRSWIKAEAA